MKTKMLLASALLFTVLAFLPREASAQVTTILEIQNTTAQTLYFDLGGFSWDGNAVTSSF